MFGFVIGTVCLVALVKMARGGCGYGYGYGACGGGGCGEGHGGGCGEGACGSYDGGGGCGGGWRGRRWGHHHGHHHHHGQGHGPGGWGGGPWFMGSWMMRRLFERLETTPGQEKVIQQAVEEARNAARSAAEKVRASRDDVARAMTGESFDESTLGGAFARHDEAMQEVRKAVAGGLAKIHEALDPRQRQILAELIARGPGGFGGGRWGGPYRGGAATI